MVRKTCLIVIFAAALFMSAPPGRARTLVDFTFQYSRADWSDSRISKTTGMYEFDFMVYGNQSGNLLFGLDFSYGQYEINREKFSRIDGGTRFGFWPLYPYIGTYLGYRLTSIEVNRDNMDMLGVKLIKPDPDPSGWLLIHRPTIGVQGAVWLSRYVPLKPDPRRAATLWDAGIYYDVEYSPFVMTRTSSRRKLRETDKKEGREFKGEAGVSFRLQRLEGKVGYRYQKISGTTGRGKTFSGIVAGIRF